MQASKSLRTVIVTGANRGIGYAMVERLLKEPSPFDIIFAVRNLDLGKEAVSKLTQKHTTSASQLTLQQLDVSDSGSIDNFVKWIKAERESKFDILVNNAGIGYLKDKLQERLDTIQINFVGTVELTEKLLPHLTSDGKIIMVSSENGLLSWQGSIRKTLDDPTMTREKLMKLCDQLIEYTKTMKHTQLGWSEPTYDASKALLNAYTRWVLVKMLKGDQQCYTLDPGWCKTELGGPSAPLPVERGADTPLYLINLPFKHDEKYNGKFFMNRKVHEF